MLTSIYLHNFLVEVISSSYFLHLSLRTMSTHVMIGCKGNLVPKQQAHTTVTLLSVVISRSYLAHISLSTKPIHAMTCFLGNFIAIATSTCLCNFGLWHCIKYITDTHVPWDNTNSHYEWMLRKHSAKKTRVYHYDNDTGSSIKSLFSRYAHLDNIN